MTKQMRNPEELIQEAWEELVYLWLTEMTDTEAINLYRMHKLVN